MNLISPSPLNLNLTNMRIKKVRFHYVLSYWGHLQAQNGSFTQKKNDFKVLFIAKYKVNKFPMLLKR